MSWQQVNAYYFSKNKYSAHIDNLYFFGLNICCLIIVFAVEQM